MDSQQVDAIRERVKLKGWHPDRRLVRAVIDEYLAELEPVADPQAVLMEVMALHPRSVVRTATASGAERDDAFCEWCGVPYPCPTVVTAAMPDAR